LTDPEAKAQWFFPPSGWEVSGYRFDARVGGTEHVESRPPEGEPHVYDAIYHAVDADQRVVFSYEMHLGDRLLSVSITTIELVSVEDGTHLTFTEQGAFFDADEAGVGSRVEGSEMLLDNLGKALLETR
jgi:uncharacterized protein YndB with AHSA1/START domain